jgi:hypothetical protein
MARNTDVRDILPEDAYDAADPFGERLRIVEAMCASWAIDTRQNRELRRGAIMRTLDKINDEALSFFDRVTAAHALMRDTDG